MWSTSVKCTLEQDRFCAYRGNFYMVFTLVPWLSCSVASNQLLGQYSNLQQPKHSSAMFLLLSVQLFVVNWLQKVCLEVLQIPPTLFFKWILNFKMHFHYSVQQKWVSHIQCEMSTYYRKSFTCELLYQCLTFTPTCYSIYDTCLRASSYLICCRRNTAFFRSSCMLARFSSAPSIDFTALKSNTIMGEG